MDNVLNWLLVIFGYLLPMLIIFYVTYKQIEDRQEGDEFRNPIQNQIAMAITGLVPVANIIIAGFFILDYLKLKQIKKEIENEKS